MENLIKSFIAKNPEILFEFGERLFIKISEVAVNDPTEAFNYLTLDDCVNYISNRDVNYGFVRRKSVIEDNLAKEFPEVKFEESDPELDHAVDIDYLGWVGEKAFGIQIKPVTIKSNFGNYSASERMKASFISFTEEYGGQVFVVYSIDDKIKNLEVIAQIAAEIVLLSK